MLDPGTAGPDVKAWRASLGLSRESFAKFTGLTPGAIWRIEAKNQLKPGEFEKLQDAHGRQPSPDVTTRAPRAPKPQQPIASITLVDPEPSLAAPITPLLGVTTPSQPPITAPALAQLPALPGTLEVSPTDLSAQDGFRRFSNSEVQTWKRCRRKWWFAYHRKLRPKHEDPTGARAIGVDLHEALRYHYVDNSSTKVNVQDAIEAIIARNWNDIVAHYAALGEEVPLSVETQFRSEADLERIIIEGYLQWVAETGADAELEVIGSEQYLEAELPEADNVKIIGRLDARVRRIHDNVRLFMDHKSVGNFQQLTRVLHMNEQMMWYILLETLQPNDGTTRVAGAMYNMLRRVKRSANAKPPFYERIEVHHNKHEIESFKRRLVGTVDDILNAETDLDENQVPHQYIVYPTPTKDCPWDCPFFQVCGMTDDGSYADGMIKNFFVEGDPLSYYVDPTTPPS